MAFDFLVDKKKQSELYKTYRTKPKVLYTQDQFLNIYLSKFNIKKYVLFIKRENEYSVAAWKGYISEDIEYVKYAKDSLFADFMISDQQIQSASMVHNFYNESIMLPREAYPIIKSEKENWDTIGGTHCFPLIKDKKELFGFFICHSLEHIEKSKEVSDFSEAMFHWAKEYHNLYLSNVAKREIEQYEKFVQYVDKISKVQDEEALATEVLSYYLELFKSTKGILYELKKGYFHAQKIQNIGFVRAYSRKDFQKLSSKSIVEIKEDIDPFYEELGSGSARVIFFNTKYAVVIKQVFRNKLDASFIDTATAITDRAHKCQIQKKSSK